MPVISGGGSGSGGGLVKLFDSTLGADAASIDTGANGIPTAYRSLTIYISARTATAGAGATLLGIFNNDSGANYVFLYTQQSNTTVSGVAPTAASAMSMDCHGAGGTAGVTASIRLEVPNYAGTTFNKTVLFQSIRPDTTAANGAATVGGFLWSNTAAISRFAVSVNGGVNLLAGSRVTIYGTP